MKDEKELIEGEENETEEANQEAAPEKSQDRKYSDDDLNRILAKERRSATVKYNALKSQFDSLQQEMDKKREAEEAILMEKVNKLREGQAPQVLKLLDKLDPQEQLEWLSDDENRIPVVEKKTIPPLPTERNAAPKKSPTLGTFI
jgi:seryl-tRNA synthetase